jgi:hypothetical protein
MAIVEHAELSEINLRFRGGALVGRECWHRTTVQKDDVTISETGEKATLTDEELADILGGTTADLTAQIEALKSERDEAVAAKGVAESVVATKDARIAELEAQVAVPEPEEPTLPKLLVVNRLIEAKLLDDAYAVLGGPGKPLYERWQASSQVRVENDEVRALLEAIGADLDVILAPE